MKIRFDADSLRIRLDEAGFERLQRGETVSTALMVPGGVRWAVSLTPADAMCLRATGDEVALTVPSSEVEALASRLPSREGLAFDCPRPGLPPLRVNVEVDVRDSVRSRRAR
jgi:hypothetical protein